MAKSQTKKVEKLPLRGRRRKLRAKGDRRGNYTFWRKKDPVQESGTGSEIRKGGMWEHQRKWWNLPNFIKAMVAGYGAGKTLIGSKRAIALALANNGSPHLWVSPSYKIAKRTVIPTITDLLDGKRTLDSSLSYNYNKSDNEFTISHRGRKATIWVASGDDPTSLKGPNVGSGTIDEPFIQSKEVFDQMLARVRDPRARHREIGLLGTPEQLNWGYDVCEGDEKDNYDIGIVHVSTLANRALPQQYFDTLISGYTDKMKQAYLDGQFVNLAKGQIYYGFSKSRNVVRIEDPGIELEVGMDFNVDPMSAVVFWRNGRHMHVVAEIEIENADTQYMADILRQNNEGTLEGIVRGQIRNFLTPEGLPRIRSIYPDASGVARSTNSPGGRSDFTILRDKPNNFELYVKAANPLVRDRENAVNGKLNPVRGVTSLTIDPECRRLQKYLMNYTHEQRLKQKQMSHLIDALGYPVAYLYPINKPRIEVAKIYGH